MLKNRSIGSLHFKFGFDFFLNVWVFSKVNSGVFLRNTVATLVTIECRHPGR